MPEEDRRGESTLLWQRQVNTYARTGQERGAPWVRTGSGWEEMGTMYDQWEVDTMSGKDWKRWALSKVKKETVLKKGIERWAPSCNGKRRAPLQKQITASGTWISICIPDLKPPEFCSDTAEFSPLLFFRLQWILYTYLLWDDFFFLHKCEFWRRWLYKSDSFFDFTTFPLSCNKYFSRPFSDGLDPP